MQREPEDIHIDELIEQADIEQTKSAIQFKNKMLIEEQKKNVEQLTKEQETNKVAKYIEVQEAMIEKHSGILLLYKPPDYDQISNELLSRKYIPFKAMHSYYNSGTINALNFIVGVIIKKSEILKTKKGDNYIRVTISDLTEKDSDFFCKDCFYKSIKVLLFGDSYKRVLNESQGTVFVIYNPKIETTDYGPCISLNNSEKLHCIGKSKDYGVCSSLNYVTQMPCTNCVNTSFEKVCKIHQHEAVSRIKSERPGLRSDIMRRKEVLTDYKDYKGQSTLDDSTSSKCDKFKVDSMKLADEAKLSQFLEKRKKGKVAECEIDVSSEPCTIDFKALLKRKAEIKDESSKKSKLE